MVIAVILIGVSQVSGGLVEAVRACFPTSRRQPSQSASHPESHQSNPSTDVSQDDHVLQAEAESARARDVILEDDEDSEGHDHARPSGCEGARWLIRAAHRR